MALTEFVRNVQDLSDDGGYKFRFHCDRCSDGVESQYVRSSANVLKTGVQVMQMLRNFGGWGSTAVEGIDRGLRGKEHDAAYERAVNEAMVHFTKCSRCGLRVCEHCWNGQVGLCESCAPTSSEEAAAAASRLQTEQAVTAVSNGEPAPGASTCPVCARPSGGGRFCQHCGASVTAVASCGQCGHQLPVGASFCGQCGNRVG
jgi:Double zinc ribbon